jgi:hypothetical protein
MKNIIKSLPGAAGAGTAELEVEGLLFWIIEDERHHEIIASSRRYGFCYTPQPSLYGDYP